MNTLQSNYTHRHSYTHGWTATLMGGLACLALTGCHTTQHTTGNRATLKAESERYETALQQAMTAESMQQKVTYGMNGLSLKGALKMHRRKDLLLTVNAPLLGFELARVEATQDSVWLVDKFDKVYAAYSVAALSEYIGGDVDLEALQCLLTGRIYVPGRGAATKSDFKRFNWTAEGDALVGTYTAGNRYTLTYTISADNFLTQTRVETANGSTVAEWNYSGHTQSDTYYYPTQEQLSVKRGEAQSLSGTLTLGAPTIPTGNWTAFSPTSSYKQVEAKELVETLKKNKK